MRARLANAGHCYQSELARDPRIEGQLVVRLIIDKGGHVTRVEPVTSAVSEPLGACIARMFRSTEFPTFVDGQELAAVEYGITFEN